MMMSYLDHDNTIKNKTLVVNVERVCKTFGSRSSSSTDYSFPVKRFGGSRKNASSVTVEIQKGITKNSLPPPLKFYNEVYGRKKNSRYPPQSKGHNKVRHLDSNIYGGVSISKDTRDGGETLDRIGNSKNFQIPPYFNYCKELEAPSDNPFNKDGESSNSKKSNKSGTKSVGNSSSGEFEKVLDNLSLHIESGTIYALLGPSGCGKTTLLSCLVGRKSLDSGRISYHKHFNSNSTADSVEFESQTLMERPVKIIENRPFSSKIGYMPQELAVYEDMTVSEILHFYGKLHNLSQLVLRNQIRFLCNLLQLPPKTRLIRTLSGGQKRRISFAISLLHNPDLVILDEPTVGVDPILRKKIWTYLRELVSRRRPPANHHTGNATTAAFSSPSEQMTGKSVIITTHYIEEAVQADVVGLMRHGKILIQGNPQKIMNQFQVTKLEDVFLRLCEDNDDEYSKESVDSSEEKSYSEQEDIGSSLTGDTWPQQNHLSKQRAPTTKTLKCKEMPDGPIFTITPPSSMKSSIAHRNNCLLLDKLISGGRNKFQHQVSPLTTEEGPSITSSLDNSTYSCCCCTTVSTESYCVRGQEFHLPLESKKSMSASNLFNNAMSSENHQDNSRPTYRSDTKLQVTHESKVIENSKKEVSEKEKKRNFCSVMFTLMTFFIMDSWTKISALISKNVIKMKRNIYLLLFIFVLPAIQVILFCISIGRPPVQLRIITVNEEVSQQSDCLPFAEISECEFESLSCHFLHYITRTSIPQRTDLTSKTNSSTSDESFQLLSTTPNTQVVIQHEKSVNEAELAAKYDSNIWAVVHIPSNFSKYYFQRLWAAIDADDEVLNGSSIEIKMDKTNQQIYLTLQSKIGEAYSSLLTDLLKACEISPRIGKLPIEFSTLPILSSDGRIDKHDKANNSSFTNFMAPGLIIIVVFFLALALTSETVISERKDGLIERLAVSGVKSWHIVISQVVTQLTVLISQAGVALATLLFLYEVPCEGPVYLLFILTILQGIVGMAYGLLISCSFDDMATAMQMSVASFFPILLLSGIIWPIQSMPLLLQSIVAYLPSTGACQAMRDVMLKGWDLNFASVQFGLVSSTLWILILILTSIIVCKIKNY